MEETWKDIEGYEGLYQVSNNKLHAYKNGLKCAKKGAENILSKKIIGKNKQTGEIINFDFIGDVINFGFNKCNVINCLKGVCKTHKNYIWNYAS